MRLLAGLLTSALVVFVLVVGLPAQIARNQGHQTIATEQDYHRAIKELSNWGRWGKDDELGAANLITPAKRKQAVGLVKEGITVSLAHDVFQEKAADAPTILERVVLNVSPTGASDRYHIPAPITARLTAISMPWTVTSCTRERGTTVSPWRR